MHDGRTIPLRNLKRALGPSLRARCNLVDDPNVIKYIFNIRSKVLILADFMSLVYLYNYKLTNKKKYYLKFKFYLFLERRLYPFLRHIVVQTNVELAHANTIGLGNVSILTNYVKKNSRILADLGQSKKIRIGVIAKFENIYKLQTQEFIDFVDQNLSGCVEVVLAGAGSEKLKGECVSHLGYVNDVSEFYNRIDIAACFSWKGYGFINKLAEAISYCKPVICNDGALNKMEFLKDMGCCFLVSDYMDLCDLDKMYEFKNHSEMIDICVRANVILQKKLGLKSYFIKIRQIINEINSDS